MSAQAALKRVRALAGGYPQAERTFLFGDHEVFRVREKVFLWLGEGEGGTVSVSVKLKDSQHAALLLPFVQPAAYGMAKWGWVKAELPAARLPLELVRQWLDESYRHTAPRKLVAALDAGPATPARRRAPARRRSRS